MRRIDTTSTTNMILAALLLLWTAPAAVVGCNHDAGLVVFDFQPGQSVDCAGFPSDWSDNISAGVADATGCQMDFPTPCNRRQRELNMPIKMENTVTHTIRGGKPQPTNDNNNNRHATYHNDDMSQCRLVLLFFTRHRMSNQSYLFQSA